ncbi:FAD-binding domain-containing protein [Aspergillus ellipticus CBS 707.79]|uniref:FAD-binding domain-containing protein n=1 Tax=Aspergillus ellipticus CBS 707.79 TaxID=1448320 RepID=A0A319CVU6_9EURO|nr:FAD-binding domain-containing protein [Aspergillus ellipticus CBS 707.79]
MLRSILLLPLIGLVTRSVAATPNISAIFGPSLSSGAQIFLPSQANYTEDVTQRWTTYDAPTYIGAIKPATVDDIQTIVTLAASNEIPFLATGGGHGATITYVNCTNGIEIDLSNFDTISINATANTMTVGGSVRFEDIIPPLYDAGKELPTGTAPCVGLVGATLGGGIGNLQGLHGLILDSLLSVELVTPSGDVVTASTTENADLFWAIRGAGANFGIVTSATYQIYEATNGGEVMSANFLFPGSANRSVWEIFESFDDTLPAALSLTAYAGFNQTTQEMELIVSAVYYGPKEEGVPYLASFTALNATETDLVMVAWPDLIDSMAFGADASACTTGSYLNVWGLGLAETNVDTYTTFFTELEAFAQAHPDYTGIFVVDRYSSEAAAAVPANSTSYGYGYRKINSHLLFENSYTNPSLDGVVNAFMRKSRAQFQRTSGFSEMEIYLNYAHGDEGPEVWYSPQHLPPLSQLKSQWDPDQLFSFNYPVPLA